MNKKDFVKLLKAFENEDELFVYDDATGQPCSVIGVQSMVEDGKTYLEIVFAVPEPGEEEESLGEEADVVELEEGEFQDLTEAGIDFGDGND